MKQQAFTAGSTNAPPLPVVAVGKTIGGAVIGAVVCGFLFGTVLSDWKPNPWWPADWWQWALVGAVIGGALGAAGALAEMARVGRMRGLAARLGLEYFFHGPDDVANRIGLLMAWESSVRLEHSLVGEWNGVTILVGDLVHHRRSGDNTHRVRQTVAFFQSPEIELPQFSLRAEGVWVNLMGGLVGAHDIDFDSHPEFSKAYHLSGPSPDAVRQLFQRPLLDQFTFEKRWEIRGEEGRLLMFRPRRRVPIKGLPAYLETTQGMFRQFQTAAKGVSVSRSDERPPISHMAASTVAPIAIGPLAPFARGIVTAEEVEAFVRSPAPREASSRIVGQRAGGGLCFALFAAAPLAVIGAVFAGIGALQSADEKPIPLLIGGLLIVLAAALLLGAIHYRARQRRLLEHGRLAVGRVESVERTSLMVNNQVRHRAQVAFSADGTSRVAKVSLYGGHAERARIACDQREPVSLLYALENPDRIVLALQLTSNLPLRW